MVKTTPANERDEQTLIAMIEALPKVPGPRGRPQEKPGAVVADRGYGFPWIIAAVILMGILSMIATRGSPHGSGLGKARYVVERTFSWFFHFRRLRLCYEKHGECFQGYAELAACILCAGRLRKIQRGL